MGAHILVIDDDPIMCASMRVVLEGEGYGVTTAGGGEEGLRLAAARSFDLVVLDQDLSLADGMEVLGRLRGDDPALMVVVVTARGTVESAVDALRAGACDYLPAPFTPDELRQAVRRALGMRKLTLENAILRDEVRRTNVRGKCSDVLIGESAAMRSVRAMIEKVGPTDSTVLLLGETGTGKEVAARMIHRMSLRSTEPMLTVDCGSLTETLFESELFGHMKGSFTGAHASKPGRFELASGGTLFFDEIGNIGPQVQAKLLRAIQEREITRVGGTQAIRVDIRLIAATNMDLASAVGGGAFREDLFYRLSVLPIQLPPLRERPEDIPELATFFLQRYVARRRKHVRGISDEAMTAMVRYDWPGNVRELETLIERAVVLSENSVLRPADLMFFGRMPGGTGVVAASRPRMLAQVEAEHIASTLDQLGWQISRASRVLGIDRKTLRRKIQQYGLKDTGTSVR